MPYILQQFIYYSTETAIMHLGKRRCTAHFRSASLSKRQNQSAAEVNNEMTTELLPSGEVSHGCSSNNSDGGREGLALTASDGNI